MEHNSKKLLDLVRETIQLRHYSKAPESSTSSESRIALAISSRYTEPL